MRGLKGSQNKVRGFQVATEAVTKIITTLKTIMVIIIIIIKYDDVRNRYCKDAQAQSKQFINSSY